MPVVDGTDDPGDTSGTDGTGACGVGVSGDRVDEALASDGGAVVATGGDGEHREHRQQHHDAHEAHERPTGHEPGSAHERTVASTR